MFFNCLPGDTGKYRTFFKYVIKQVFEKWSKAKTTLFALRVEKDQGRAFSTSY